MRKLLATLTAFLSVLSMSFAFTACGEKENYNEVTVEQWDAAIEYLLNSTNFTVSVNGTVKASYYTNGERNVEMTCKFDDKNQTVYSYSYDSSEVRSESITYYDYSDEDPIAYSKTIAGEWMSGRASECPYFEYWINAIKTLPHIGLFQIKDFLGKYSDYEYDSENSVYTYSDEFLMYPDVPDSLVKYTITLAFKSDKLAKLVFQSNYDYNYYNSSESLTEYKFFDYDTTVVTIPKNVISEAESNKITFQ